MGQLGLVELSDNLRELVEAVSYEATVGDRIQAMGEGALRYELRADGHTVLLEQHTEVPDGSFHGEFVELREYPTIFRKI